MTTDDYLNLITSEYRSQPKFIAMANLLVQSFVQMQAIYDAIDGPLFDLDTPPIGDQLDKIGVLVGVNRNIAIPIPGVLFSWDDTDADGWDMGIWSGPNNPTAITVLPDDAYLTVIRAKIAANHWDGTTEGAYSILEGLFPNLLFLIQDEEDMTFNIGIIGTVDSLTLALLTSGYFELRPEGVLIGAYYTQKDTNPFFGWDLETPYIQGWDEGSWAIATTPT